MIASRAHAAPLLAVGCLLLCAPLRAAPVPAADSLQTEQVMKLAQGHVETEPDSALAEAQHLFEIGRRATYPRAIAYAYRILAITANRRSDNKNAIRYYQRSIDISKATGDAANLSQDLYNIADAYRELSDYEKSFVSSTEALRMKLMLKDTLGIGRCYRQLAEYYDQTSNPASAARAIDQSIAMLRQLRGSVRERRSLERALITRSLLELNTKQYTTALKTLREVVQIADSIGDATPLSAVHINAGFCYEELGKPGEALRNYLLALAAARNVGDVKDEAIALDNIGQLYLRNKDYRMARQYLTDGLRLAESINSFIDLRNVHANLSELYFSTGNLRQAYLHEEAYARFADSLLSQEKMRVVSNLSIKYETEETASRNALLQKENDLARLTAERDRSRRHTLIYSFAGITLLLVGGLLFLYYYLRQQKLAGRLSSERLKQRLLLAQMNPHFIFNSIDNIQGLIFKNENHAAVTYLTRFSRLTRQILENSAEDYIPLSEEAAMLDNYLSLQQLLYNQRFTFAVHVDPELDADKLLIPPMLVQPFVENAIRHGLKNKLQEGRVQVSFYRQGRQLLVEVCDNGDGLLPQQSGQGHRSLSTRITQERLDRLLGRNRRDIQVENTGPAGEAPSGVRTRFEIPYVYDA